ncbi:MAG: PAS domain-containing sensor histidine kinase [Bacteroidales bacterium]|nr:PAS domain-containing sensor histidine kinase [Bacteroidales bacterium]
MSPTNYKTLDAAINKQPYFYSKQHGIIVSTYTLKTVKAHVKRNFVMNVQDKTKEELIQELKRLEQENRRLKIDFEKNIAERELAQSKFQMLFEQSPVGMALVIHETGEFIEVNNSILQSTGYTREEFLKLSYWDITPREYEEQEIEQLQTLDKTGSFGPNFKEYIRKDGTRYPLSISGALFTDTDGRKVVWGIIEDLSERKEKELIIKKQNEVLQKHNATKDKILSIIAHDLKSSFHAIINFSNLLLEQTKDKDTDGIDDYAQIINQSSNHALNLLINLMEWSQLQTGRMEFRPEYFEINTIVDDAIFLMQGNAKQKSISITSTLTHGIQVFADKTMLSAVVRNLLSNAVKFTQPNGKITVTSAVNQNKLIISVIDNGIGIPKEGIEKLFKIDKVYTTPGTQQEKGTGLGLDLCKEFIEKHNGEIWVDSVIEKGSTFSFSLPLHKKKQQNIDA